MCVYIYTYIYTLHLAPGVAEQKHTTNKNMKHEIYIKKYNNNTNTNNYIIIIITIIIVVYNSII